MAHNHKKVLCLMTNKGVQTFCYIIPSLQKRFYDYVKLSLPTKLH